jgi:hypothetical protein
MNPNKRQSAAIAIFLIGLGLVIWLNLWWLLWPGALVAGGVLAYRERRRLGRTAEAVQVGLWCFGLAVVVLLHFWPGVLLLAGTSLLLRGREAQVDDTIQRMVAQARSRRATQRPITSQQVPITTQQVPITTQQPQAAPPAGYDAPATGQTSHLHE